MNKINNLKFPALALLLVMMITPLIEYNITGGFSAITKTVEVVCLLPFLGFIAVAAYSTFSGKNN